MHRRRIVRSVGVLLAVPTGGCVGPQLSGQCTRRTTTHLDVRVDEPAFERVSVSVTAGGDAVLSETYDLDGDGVVVAREDDVFRHGSTYRVEATAADQHVAETFGIDCYGVDVVVQGDRLSLHRVPLEG